MTQIYPLQSTFRAWRLPRLLTILLLFPSIAYAEVEPGKFSLGVGLILIELYDDPVLSDRNAQYGGLLSAGYKINKNFLLLGNYYSPGNGDFSDTDIDGTELLIYYGRDLTRRGLQLSMGIGYFSEDWDGPDNSESISGLQLGYGIGYRWDETSLTALIHVRNSGDYDDIDDRIEDDIRSVYGLSIIYAVQL